ncbi:23 kDa jasmonate-induced protein-like [Pyrus ussuriensis x Pyrus communis]|uniref:23 kDa jasmonate-induced protein-like n=1 Tax=Pyrus ussuriensis x Pyrus communis TaxID=2448454 RepID=A0A5N5I139_9ROSA|nr:23 kDa jasmonate-induced protein-like [Pyrus ussuriensis x Pyrus communis]
MKNADKKDFNARSYVEELKKQYGDGVSTLCLVYNATGDTIRYAYKNDWFGHIGKVPYPPLIANGQWGAFLHVKTAGESSGSDAAIVYRGLKNVSDECDCMLSWRNPSDSTSSANTVYTETREPDHFLTYWDYIHGKLEESEAYSKDTWDGCVSIISTGIDTSPVVEAILTIENA